jgi:hypothetical protein
MENSVSFMPDRLRIRVLGRFMCLLIGAGVAAQASTILSYTGDLRTDATYTTCGMGCTLGAGNTDADYAQFAAVVKTFSIASPSTMFAITFSYGGGTNGANQVIPQGGFEPYLSLFDAGGNFLASTFSGITCPAGAHANTVSNSCFDVQLDGGTLGAGSYQIAISAFENMSLAENNGAGTLADGFTGLGNLAPSGENLNYAFDVVLNSTSPVPEPGSGTLLLTALGLLLIGKFRLGHRWMRRSRQSK